MTRTETELRAALQARAADAPAVDTEALLAGLDNRASSAGERSPGRQWGVAVAVAVCVVGLAAVPVVVLAQHRGHDTALSPAASGTSAVASSTAPVKRPTATAPVHRVTTPAPSTSAYTGVGVDPHSPLPADSNWVDTSDEPNIVIDPAAIVFSDDPITAFYTRHDQQLSILPAAATAKDSSDAQWHAAVQVYLPGSGFDPATIGNPVSVTVNGVARQYGTLTRLLKVAGPARVPSLLWQVGQAWVVLQIDTPAEPTVAQLSTAAARIDVHRG